MWITIRLKILVSVTTESISPSNRSNICTSSSASNLWKSSAPHYWEMQAWQSSRARYQPNQWSSGASDFHQELQSKFTIEKNMNTVQNCMNNTVIVLTWATTSILNLDLPIYHLYPNFAKSWVKYLQNLVILVCTRGCSAMVEEPLQLETMI